MEAAINNKTIQVLNFNTRDFQASIDIEHLLKVIALPLLYLSPESPDYVIGLMNLAGSVIPIIDLSTRLKASLPQTYTINTPIVICKDKKQNCFGLIVDGVSDIRNVTEDMIDRKVGSDDNHQVIE